LQKLQEFIEEYPESEFRDNANVKVKKLRNKLAEKMDETALLYIKLHAYDSAIVAYEDLLSQYYDTDFAEKAYIGIVRSYSLMKNYGEAIKYYDANKDKIVSADLKAKVLHYIDSIGSEDKE